MVAFPNPFHLCYEWGQFCTRELAGTYGFIDKWGRENIILRTSQHRDPGRDLRWLDSRLWLGFSTNPRYPDGCTGTIPSGMEVAFSSVYHRGWEPNW